MAFEWDADDPAAGPVFGGVCCGDHEIYLCRDGQAAEGLGHRKALPPVAVSVSPVT
jgi:hypothetical protein